MPTVLLLHTAFGTALALQPVSDVSTALISQK